MKKSGYLFLLMLCSVLALDGSELEYEDEFDDNEEPEDADYSLGFE